jgi:cephalosporin hydroxylase
LLKLLSKLRPKTLLEIGTANGGTLFLFCQIASPTATIISVDLPSGPFGGGYPEWKIPFYKSFATNKQKLYLIREDSHASTTLKYVEKILEGHKLDFLFIDGDHTYEGVKKDFEMYFPLVRKGGIIAFHDIMEHSPETGCEVSMFWDEIKHSYSSLEIVKDWNQKWAGRGVVYV